MSRKKPRLARLLQSVSGYGNDCPGGFGRYSINKSITMFALETTIRIHILTNATET